MKNKSISLDSLLAEELKDESFRIAFDEPLFFLNIAHLISDLRQKAGISQAALAKRTKVSQPLIARLERGDSRRVPTFDTIFKVLKALGYSASLQVKKYGPKKAA